MAKECSNTSCDKSSCEGCSSKKPQSLLAEMNAHSNVKHVIGVVSGKGGVGKSFVTGSLANMMAAQGYKVGILDADITGPSIPKMYGLKGAAMANDEGIYPMITRKRNQGNVYQPSASYRRYTGNLERTGAGKHGKTVLDRCYLGRCRLSLCGYASRNR